MTWNLYQRRSRSQILPLVPIDPNWYVKYQWNGQLPAAVLDFVNGMYWDGVTSSQSPTVPSALLTNGQIKTGLGLDCTSANANADNMTAAGALLTGLQGGEWMMNCSITGYTENASTFNLAMCASTLGAPDTSGDQYLGLGAKTDYCYNIISNASLGFPGSIITPTTGTSFHGVSTNTSGTLRVLAGCFTGFGAGGESDAFPFASNPALVYVGGLTPGNSGDTLNGYMGYLAVVNGKAVSGAGTFFQIPAFYGPNGWIYNPSSQSQASGSAINYGNVLAFEYTQPWTLIAAVKIVAGSTNSGNGSLDGILLSNLKNSPFPGYEVYFDGNNVIHVRIINTSGSVFIGKYGTTVFGDAQWHIIAVTYDGSGLAAGINMYVDGVLENMTVESDNLGNNSIVGAAGNNYFVLGNEYNVSFPLLGAIGLFRLYNVVKPIGFIQSFTTAIFTANQLPPLSLDSTCVLAPSLSEGGAATTTADLSASGLTGTLASTSNWLRG